ncbi:MAG: AbrB/MazE/SpoVT family DNA-binding domain-containing protein [Acidobacteriota bacterium]
MKQTKIRRSGGSLSATLPKDMVDRLHIEAGDTMFLVETDRGLLLTPYDPGFEQALSLYRRGARKYRNALRKLAK